MKLTPTQERLLKFMTDPDNIGKSYTEISSETGISRNTIYNAIKNKSFVNKYNDIVTNILGTRTSDILNASIRNALSPEGYNDRKMLLTITGLYNDKVDVSSKNLNMNYNYEHGVDPFEGLTTEELKEIAFGKPIVKISGAEDLED